MNLEFTTRGLDAFSQLLLRTQDNLDSAAAQSVNRAADFGRSLASKDIREQVNFKANYLNSDDRLAVRKRASPSDLEAVVRGRDRPTSLARFATTRPTVGRGKRRLGVRVKVKGRGGSKTIKGAFFMRLRKGSAAVTEENSNMGLAVRLSEAEGSINKRAMIPIGSDLYLLYGPSVGQVARSVFEERAGVIADQLESEFTRNAERFIRG
ncbi:MAG TPA: phage tail protein [Pyrinomonadaceae bacterium]|jgi:hypothetical protein